MDEAAGTSGATLSQQDALEGTQSYLSFSHFSDNGPIGQFKFEGLTHEQAVYGVDAVGMWDIVGLAGHATARPAIFCHSERRYDGACGAEAEAGTGRIGAYETGTEAGAERRGAYESATGEGAARLVLRESQASHLKRISRPQCPEKCKRTSLRRRFATHFVSTDEKDFCRKPHFVSAGEKDAHISIHFVSTARGDAATASDSQAQTASGRHCPAAGRCATLRDGQPSARGPHRQSGPSRWRPWRRSPHQPSGHTQA